MLKIKCSSGHSRVYIKSNYFSKFNVSSLKMISFQDECTSDGVNKWDGRLNYGIASLSVSLSLVNTVHIKKFLNLWTAGRC